MNRRDAIKKAKRIVVKIGSALLTDEKGTLKPRFMAKLANEIMALKKQGRQIILVSSGAVAAGRMAASKIAQPRTIPAKQALAAIGQPRLMQAYERCFARYQQLIGQILLTSEDVLDRNRYAHARDTLKTLLAMDVLPIFNENDTVAVSEIKFGDNDELSAQVAGLAEADLLIILTNVAGLYTGHPHKDPQAMLVSDVERIDARIEAMADPEKTLVGTGGMITKLRAAKKATGMGTEMVIACGQETKILQRILAGEPLGTAFHRQGERPGARKCWIGFTLKPQGELILDAGATKAIQSAGKSLLPSGIKRVQGEFQVGDCVELKTEAGQAIARGLAKYSSEEVNKIIGAKTAEIERRLGYKNSDEVIHRDDLTVYKE